jgi:toxin ParE1/3/4
LTAAAWPRWIGGRRSQRPASRYARKTRHEHRPRPAGGPRRFPGCGSWYEEKRSGLGQEFLDAVEAAFVSIGENPLQFGRLETNRSTRDIRRCLLKRFPYLVIFEVRGDECLVVAVAHGRRRPNFWRKRLSDSEPG